MTSIVERRAQDPTALLFVCDVTPPRGGEASLFDPLRGLRADYLSVAYNTGQIVRMNPVLGAAWLRAQTGQDVLFTLATRDMNKVALQSLLLGAQLWGLENLLIVKGDPFSASQRASVQTVSDIHPLAFMESVRAMNQGRDYRGGNLRAPTNFCVGASLDVGHDFEREIPLTQRKVRAGVQYFLQQALFDPQRLVAFLDAYAAGTGDPLTAPIFCGVQVMTAQGFLYGEIPAWVTDDLAKGRSGEDIAVETVQRFVERRFRSIYLIPPVMRGGRREYAAAQRVIAVVRAADAERTA